MTFVCSAALAACAVPTTQAQEGDTAPARKGQPTPKATQPDLKPTVAASMATIEMIVDAAVRNIGKRYNLNESQLRETNALMKREVQKFLKENESQVWPVIRDLLASQMGRDQMPPEEMKRLGAAARPLLELAKDAIYRGNDEWRLILTPEQQQMHDFDLGEMNKQFAEIDRRFETWQEGKPIPDGGIFPVQKVENSPAIPPKPIDEGPLLQAFSLTFFDTFVENFIKENKLDEAQIDAARSILKESKEKAGDFRNKNKDELARIGTATRDAVRERDAKKKKEAEAERKKLMEPVYGMFAQMEERLRALLTSTQLAAYEAKHRGRPVNPRDAAEAPERAPVPAPKAEGEAEARGPAPAVKDAEEPRPTKE